MTLNVIAGGSPGISYQWEINTGSGWSVISGATSASYNTGALSSTTQYRVFLASAASGCEDIYSNSVSVTVTPDIAITTQPTGNSICSGGSHTMSVVATGSPGIQYQWEVFSSGIWVQVPGATSSTYVAGPLTSTTDYRVFVYATQSGCEDLYSNPVTITVYPDISISAQPVGGSICTGGDFNLTVTASGSPDIHYQWEAFNGS
jgi:hypothetical protein